MGKFNSRLWERIYFKVGTMPGTFYFVSRMDLPKLSVDKYLQIRPDDGSTKPEFQHPIGVMVNEIRATGNGRMYVVEKM